MKVDTTPHDLTVCLFDCLAQAPRNWASPMRPAFLEHIDLIRWSTTITSNVLAELRGPRIGLLVSKGHEKDLYGNESQQLGSEPPRRRKRRHRRQWLRRRKPKS